MPSSRKTAIRQGSQFEVDMDEVENQSSAGVVESPCVGTCVLSARDETCLGCFRTRAEIANWLAASEHDRAIILQRCARRRSADPGLPPKQT